jgi:hypothetical protein
VRCGDQAPLVLPPGAPSATLTVYAHMFDEARPASRAHHPADLHEAVGCGAMGGSNSLEWGLAALDAGCKRVA